MKNRNNLLVIMLLPFLTVFGCTEKQKLEIWLVENEMPLYESYLGDSQKIIAVLQKNDVCIPGAIQIAKVYQYTEVLCLEKGYGWITDDYVHKITKNSK